MASALGFDGFGSFAESTLGHSRSGYRLPAGVIGFLQHLHGRSLVLRRFLEWVSSLSVAGNASRLMVSGDGYFGCRHGCQAGGQKAAETTAWPTDLDAGVHFSGRHAASSGTARPGLATSMIEHVGRCAGARYSRQLRIFRHEFLRLPPSPSFFAAFCNPCQSSARRHLHGDPHAIELFWHRRVSSYVVLLRQAISYDATVLWCVVTAVVAPEAQLKRGRNQLRARRL